MEFQKHSPSIDVSFLFEKPEAQSPAGQRDDAYMAPILDELSFSVEGRKLLEFANKNGTEMLVEPLSQQKTVVAFATLSLNRLTIFKDDSRSVSEQAASVAHELRHLERDVSLGAGIKKGGKQNPLVVSKMQELDAYLIEDIVDLELYFNKAVILNVNPDVDPLIVQIQIDEEVASSNTEFLQDLTNPKSNFMFHYEKKFPYATKKLTDRNTQKDLGNSHVMLSDDFMRQWFVTPSGKQYVPDSAFPLIRKWATTLTPVGTAVAEERASVWPPTAAPKQKTSPNPAPALTV